MALRAPSAAHPVLASAVAIILLVADETRAQALSGLAVVMLGVPVYHLWRRMERRAG